MKTANPPSAGKPEATRKHNAFHRMFSPAMTSGKYNRPGGEKQNIKQGYYFFITVRMETSRPRHE